MQFQGTFPSFQWSLLKKKSTELIRATIQLLLLIKSSCYNVRRMTIRRSTYYRGMGVSVKLFFQLIYTDYAS
jgi:hypothetical protein